MNRNLTRVALEICISLGLLLGIYSVAEGQSSPSPAQSFAGATRLLRFADISKDNVVFVYAGDLWIAPREGGPARRLTSHVGDELYPKFSPDGKWIAFTGEYDGNPDVYVMRVGSKAVNRNA